jgi:hypothetical protein
VQRPGGPAQTGAQVACSVNALDAIERAFAFLIEHDLAAAVAAATVIAETKRSCA